ncbi:MAG TPA: hypothetical protein PKI69_06810 [Rhodocyclaceae bacterium]|nr:hypothetical protein [Rhodocyclaceae bacterium]
MSTRNSSPPRRATVSEPRRLSQAPRHLDEDLVTHGVAPGVVEELEAVQVQVAHRHQGVVPRGAGDGLTQAVGQQDPVGQSGQGVVVGEEADLLFGAYLVGDVAQQGVIAVGPSVRRGGAAQTGLDPAFVAGLPVVPAAAEGGAAAAGIEPGEIVLLDAVPEHRIHEGAAQGGGGQAVEVGVILIDVAVAAPAVDRGEHDGCALGEQAEGGTQAVQGLVA